MMERTGTLVRLVISWLPSPEDTTIFDDDTFGGGEGGGGGGGGAAVEGGSGAAVKRKGEGVCDAAGKAEGEGGGSLAVARSSIPGGQEAVGWYDQYMDLYLRGRPTSSHLEPIWAGRPLRIHDRGLVLAQEYLRGRNPEARELDLVNKITYSGKIVDLTLEITDILNNHPGPVDSFRIDSSCWHDANSVLLEWIKILSEKGISRLMMLNLAHSPDLLFPIEDLQSPRLIHLSLGFMKIPDLELNCFDYSCLVTLQLFGCSTNGRRLSWVISHCPCLEELVVGLSSENLRVISQSLVRAQLWECQASWFTVSSCPNLKLLTLGVEPARGCTSVSIAVDGTPRLEKLNGLQLHRHDITINGTYYMAKDVNYLNSVEELILGLNMSNAEQRYQVLQILRCMPTLRHLTLRRMDRIAVGEGIDTTFDGLRDITCAKSQLRYFKIADFKGGPTERDILCCIIKYATQLIEVHIECSEICTRQDMDHAIEVLRNCPRASEACYVKIRPPKDFS
ncbi:unnamed protein product [Urochloa humidicola]